MWDGSLWQNYFPLVIHEYDMFALFKWFENMDELNITLTEPNKNKREIKITKQMQMVKSGNINQMPTLRLCGYYFLNQTFLILGPDH